MGRTQPSDKTSRKDVFDTRAPIVFRYLPYCLQKWQVPGKWARRQVRKREWSFLRAASRISFSSSLDLDQNQAIYGHFDLDFVVLDVVFLGGGKLTCLAQLL